APTPTRRGGGLPGAVLDVHVDGVPLSAVRGLPAPADRQAVLLDALGLVRRRRMRDREEKDRRGQHADTDVAPGSGHADPPCFADGGATLPESSQGCRGRVSSAPIRRASAPPGWRTSR